MFFWAIIAIVAIEYLGLGNYLSLLSKLPLFLSIIVFLAAVVKYNISEVFKKKQTVLFTAFISMTFISFVYALISLYVYRVLKVQVGYLLLMISIYYHVKTTKQLRMFTWAMIGCHAFLILLNLPKLSSGARVGYFQAGYFLGDGNDFAWSLCIFLPLVLFLIQDTKRKIIKWTAVFFLILFLFGIIGTGSRGASLSMFGTAAFLISMSKYKLKSIFIVVCLLIIGLLLAPSSYVDRIYSIGEYESDSSAQGRITAWKAATRMAIDHPLGVGAGNFNSAYGHFYIEGADLSKMVVSHRWISPHSIYFLSLGEYGFIGLFIILNILFSCFKGSRLITKKYVDNKENNHDFNLPLYAHYLSATIIAYAIGGAFLGGINYPHIYIAAALCMKAGAIYEERDKVNR